MTLNAEKTNNKQSLKQMSICLIIALLLLINSIIPTFAANESNNTSWTMPTQEEVDGLSGLQRSAWETVEKVYTSKKFSGLESLLKFDTEGNATNASSAIWRYAESTYRNVCIPIGYALIILYFLIELLQKVTTENINPELLLKSLIKLFLAIILIDHGIDLIKGFLEFGTKLVNDISTNIVMNRDADTSSENMKLLEQYWNQIKDAKNSISQFTLWVTLGSSLLFPRIIIDFSILIAEVICYGRLLEIGILSAFSPIGMANVFSDGTRGPGFRYMKKLLAVIVQGAVIMAILVLYQNIMAGVQLGDTSGGPIGQCVITLSLVALLKKSQDISSELIGA